MRCPPCQTAPSTIFYLQRPSSPRSGTSGGGRDLSFGCKRRIDRLRLVTDERSSTTRLDWMAEDGMDLPQGEGGDVLLLTSPSSAFFEGRLDRRGNGLGYDTAIRGITC